MPADCDGTPERVRLEVELLTDMVRQDDLDRTLTIPNGGSAASASGLYVTKYCPALKRV